MDVNVWRECRCLILVVFVTVMAREWRVPVPAACNRRDVGTR
jgi:hypothetical protein